MFVKILNKKYHFQQPVTYHEQVMLIPEIKNDKNNK